jgi:hypothetical protein
LIGRERGKVGERGKAKGNGKEGMMSGNWGKWGRRGMEAWRNGGIGERDNEGQIKVTKK